MNEFQIPENAPIWVTLLTLLAGWVAANVWPVLRDMLQKKFGVEMNAVQSQIALLEKHLENETKLSVAIERLSVLIENNIRQTEELEQALQSLTHIVDNTLKTMPTLKDFNDLAARVALVQHDVIELREHVKRCQDDQNL